MMQLHEFVEVREKNILATVNAAQDERSLEGNYWLALTATWCAFESPEQMVHHATDAFEADWLCGASKSGMS